MAMKKMKKAVMRKAKAMRKVAKPSKNSKTMKKSMRKAVPMKMKKSMRKAAPMKTKKSMRKVVAMKMKKSMRKAASMKKMSKSMVKSMKKMSKSMSKSMAKAPMKKSPMKKAVSMKMLKSMAKSMVKSMAKAPKASNAKAQAPKAAKAGAGLTGMKKLPKGMIDWDEEKTVLHDEVIQMVQEFMEEIHAQKLNSPYGDTHTNNVLWAEVINPQLDTCESIKRAIIENGPVPGLCRIYFAVLFSLVVAFQNYEGDFLKDHEQWDTKWWQEFFPKFTQHLKDCFGMLDAHKDFSLLSPKYEDWRGAGEQPAQSRSLSDYNRALTCLKIMCGEIQEEHINTHLEELYDDLVPVTSVFSDEEINAMRKTKFDAPTKAGSYSYV